MKITDDTPLLVSYAEMSEISPIWAQIPLSIFTFYRENPVNPSFSVRVENMLNYRSVYQNTADLHPI